MRVSREERGAPWRARIVAASTILVLVHVACVKTRVGDSATSVSPGSLARATLSIGAQEYPLTLCRSGDRDYFRGVDLADREKHAVLRVLIDPMIGPRLRVSQESGGSRETFLLGSRSCRKLDVGAEPTGWRVNRIRDFSGFVEADCTSDSGLEIHAHARFTHCH